MTEESINIYPKMNEFYVTEDCQPVKEGPRYITFIRDTGEPPYDMNLTRYVTKKTAVKKIVNRDGKEVETVTYEKRPVAEHYTAPVKNCEILRIRMKDRIAGFGITVIQYQTKPVECSVMKDGIDAGTWQHFHRAGFYRTVFTIASRSITGPVIPHPQQTP